MSAAALPVDLQEVREACRQLMKSYGGQDAVGARFGKDQRRVSEMLNSETMIPLHWIVHMEAATRGLPGHPHVTAALARNVDHLTVARPSAEATCANLPAAVMGISAELGDLCRTVTECMTDGRLCKDDIAAIRHELDQLDQRSASLRGTLRALELGA